VALECLNLILTSHGFLHGNWLESLSIRINCATGSRSVLFICRLSGERILENRTNFKKTRYAELVWLNSSMKYVSRHDRLTSPWLTGVIWRSHCSRPRFVVQFFCCSTIVCNSELRAVHCNKPQFCSLAKRLKAFIYLFIRLYSMEYML